MLPTGVRWSFWTWCRFPSAARRLKSYPHELSGGMRQRAMIALALSCRPSLLLADEPTTALDVTVQIQIILLLRQLQQDLDMTVIFVTHDVGVAVEIADQIAVMYAGRFVELGPTEAVIGSPAHPYTAALLTSTVLGSAFGRRLEAIPACPLTCGRYRTDAASSHAAASPTIGVAAPCRRSLPSPART